jgi:predicted DNA-binding ribbon-helix-helix protein
LLRRETFSIVSRVKFAVPQPKAPRRKSLVVKRSVNVGGHKKTSVALEDAFWNALKGIAASQGTSVKYLLETIDSERRERLHTNLSSAVRLFVLDYYQSRCRPDTGAAQSRSRPDRQSDSRPRGPG